MAEPGRGRAGFLGALSFRAVADVQVIFADAERGVLQGIDGRKTPPGFVD